MSHNDILKHLRILDTIRDGSKMFQCDLELMSDYRCLITLANLAKRAYVFQMIPESHDIVRVTQENA